MESMHKQYAWRKFGGFLMVALILVGVFAPVTLSVQNQGSYTLQTLSAHAQQTAQDGLNNTQNLKDICQGSPGWQLLDGDQIACSIMIFTSLSLFKVTGFLATVSGRLFDFMLHYTIQSSTYAQSDFIETGWGILRDLANIIFIVGLIIAALAIMLSGTISIGNGKKMLAMIIVAALLVNFSLFFTQVIVDASHILARTFYNQINTESVNVQDTLNSVQGEDISASVSGSAASPISVALLDTMDPQKLILDSEIVTQPSFSWSVIVILYVFMSVIHGVLIFTFLSLALLFVGRTVALMFGMIVSPFAFATLGTPLQNKPYVGFDAWLKDTTNNAFMVPVFLFFLYLTVLFMGGALGDIKQSLGSDLGATLGQKMINVVIPMSLIIGLLLGGKKAAAKMASEIAGQVNSLVGKGVGMLAGTALTVGAGGATLVAGGIARGAAAGAGKLLNKGAEISERGGWKNKIGGSLVKGLGSATGSFSHKVKNANVDIRSKKLFGQDLAGAAAAMGFGGLNNGVGKYTSAQAREDEMLKAERERRQREIEFSQRDLLKDKTKAQEDQANARAEKDIIEGSDEFLAAENEMEGKIKQQEEKIATTQEEVYQAQEALDQARKDAKIAGKDPSKDITVINAQAQVNAAQRELSQEKDKKTTMDKMLKDGSFIYKDTDPDSDGFGKVKESIKEETEILKKIEELERQKLLSNKKTRSPEEQAELVNLNTTHGTYDEKNLENAKADLNAVRTKPGNENNEMGTRYKQANDTIKKFDKDIKQIDRKMQAAKSKILRQEVEMMNSFFMRLSHGIGASIPGVVLGGAGLALAGAPMGSFAMAGLAGAVGSSAISGAERWAHGFTEKDRAQLQQMFRATAKKDDK
ncbi:hypothetical protein H6776_00215 [Candidatus Nomurabacteria bacterium]|nr:hypothetical protein [Candidatus Nomurabacteria bacterium]